MNTTLESKTQDSKQRASHEESQSAIAYPSRTIVHAKLEMTNPGDEIEREADAVANTVVSGGKIAREISGGSGSSGIAVPRQMESRLMHSQGGGQPMPQGLRSMMEGAFGQDFRHVRLHTDSEAASMSGDIHAKAFTLGNDIYFNRGQFAPDTATGQRLVAHELTHVVQAGGKVAREDEDQDQDDAVPYFHSDYDELDYWLYRALSPQDRALCDEGRYKETSFYDLSSRQDEKSFYRLLCIHIYDFQSLGMDYPELLIAIVYAQKEAFRRLRLASLNLFMDVFTGEDGIIDYPSYHRVFKDVGLYLHESSHDRLLNLSTDQKEIINSREYQDTKDNIEEFLLQGEYDRAVELIPMLNTYDFAYMLLNDSRVRTDLIFLRQDQFLHVCDAQFQALLYIYHKFNEDFEEIFDDFSLYLLNEYVAKPRGKWFVRAALRQILEQKPVWLNLIDDLQKAIDEQLKMDPDDRDRYAYWGNEDLSLEDLADIIKYARKDIASIKADSDMEDSCIKYAQTYPIIEKAMLRMAYYKQNIANGRQQFALIKTFTETVVSMLISGGVGIFIKGGILTSMIISAGSSAVTDSAYQLMFASKANAGDVALSGGLGAGSDAISKGLSKLAKQVFKAKVPGPAGKIAMDFFVSSTLSFAVDGSFIPPDEIHDEKLDIALYAYYMSKLGGIGYDSKRKWYYVKLNGKDPGRYFERKRVVEKLNALMKKVGE